MALGALNTHAQIFHESFNYSDGEIGAVSSGAWVPSTGTALNISSGAAVIDQGDLTGGRATRLLQNASPRGATSDAR